MNFKLFNVLILSLMSLVLGCDSQPEVGSAEAYLLSLAGHFVKDGEKQFYKELSPKTHELMNQLYQNVHDIPQVVKEFPVETSSWAEKQAGLSPEILATKNARELFFYMIKADWDKIKSLPRKQLEESLKTSRVTLESTDDKQRREVTLLMRSSETLAVRQYKVGWKLTSFEDSISKLLTVARENKKKMEMNLKEVIHRKRLKLTLPSLPK